MGCNRRTKTEITADLEKWQARLDAAEESYLAALSSVNKKLRFDDSEGAQSSEKFDLDQMQESIRFIENRIKKLRAELCGRGTIVRHVNRRRISDGGLWV